MTENQEKYHQNRCLAVHIYCARLLRPRSWPDAVPANPHTKDLRRHLRSLLAHFQRQADAERTRWRWPAAAFPDTTNWHSWPTAAPKVPATLSSKPGA